MVRTVEKKYQIWLAGYYDDFNGARAIPDDENRPSDTTYSAIKSHFGSPMNGEAFLNPRFRFSVEERTDDAGLTTNNFIATDANRYLQNDGIFEWLTHDDTRLKRDEWEGKAQLQYPDGHIANRYKFDADSAYGTSFYQRFINGHNSDASYLIPIGDNDATFGRAETLEYTTTNYNNKKAGTNTATDTKKTFMQRGHLAGVFMGEVLALDAATPSDTTTPKNTFQEIYSPAKKPFLCIQSTRQNFNSDSPTTPTLIYDGPLNTRLDGDIFTARIALQSMMVTGAWSDIGVKFEVGFAASQAGLLSDTGYTGTPAIDFTLDLADISYDTSVYVGEATNDNVWLDIDFVFDIRAGDRFKILYETPFVDGQQIRNGSILMAEFYNQNNRYTAIRYKGRNKKWEYFNDDGKSLEKAFLRAPLDFAYVSSHFNPNRRHPILNTIRAHNGVDYAAKRGTPIRATGEGVIQSVGWKSGYGRTIVIRHGGEITTLYAHLEKYHSSISKGMKVSQGQTIGYVGDSGLATAPHLHYEFRIGDKRTDPLKVALPSASPVDNSEMNLFKIQRNNYMQISDQLLSKDPNEKLFR